MAKPQSSPSRKEIARSQGAARSQERKVAQSPDYDSCKRQFGADAMSGDPNGKWLCRVKHDKQKIKRASQMMRGVHQEDSERGKEYRASMEVERVTYPDGSQREIYGHLMEQTRRKVKRMRGVGRNGKGPTEYFAIDAGKYEQGPDGLYFVWNGGWEPTSLWRKEALSPQRDPDGNVWVEVEGEWSLMDEVS